jgi:DsbC/DsbD-like thiol-disulfide interchange protein
MNTPNILHNKKMIFALGALLLTSGLLRTGQALMQSKLPEFITSFKTSTQPGAKVKSGASGKLLLTLKVADEYHIYGPKVTENIPTEVKLKPAAGVILGKVAYPGKPTDTYKGETVFTIPFTVAKNAKKGSKITLSGTIRTQGCTETSCLPPTTILFATTIEVN